jgi:capsular polysaccharide biosynthesis protein
LEEKTKETTIDIGKILLVIWDKIIWVVLSVVVVAAAAFLITRLTWKPTYTSEVQLYTVMSSADDKNTEVTTSQITIRRNVATLYVKAIKKSDSLREMSEELKMSGFDIAAGKLSGLLNVYIDSDAAEVIHVRAKTSDPELSYRICEIVSDKAASLVQDAYIGCTVATFNHPVLAVTPDSPHTARNTAIGALVGLVVSVAVIIAIYMFDRTIKGGDELETLTGVRYLGDIPDIHESFKGSKYEYGYGHRPKASK